MRKPESRWPTLGLAVALLLAAGAAAQTDRGPEELRGQVTAVAGNRITIRLSQSQWLPRAGVTVELGQEMAGMFVPLKGSFAVIQVNADSCVAQPVGREEPGAAAPGMLAVLKTSYPNQPQRVEDYIKQPNPVIVQSAEAGMPEMQHSLAMTAESKGDHDGALRWWERAQSAGTDRFTIASAARGRARILVLRNQYEDAIAVLRDAAARTPPAANELDFAAYPTLGAAVANAVEHHVKVLTDIGAVYRGPLGNRTEADRWHAAAADIMSAVARQGAPSGDEIAQAQYLLLLVHLGDLYLFDMENEEAAVPWFQAAAQQGSDLAKSRLESIGRGVVKLTSLLRGLDNRRRRVRPYYAVATSVQTAKARPRSSR